MRKLIFGFIPITILAGVSLGIVAVTKDPLEADGFVKFLFFASLAAFIWGCGAIAFFIINFFSNDRPTDALRRGFFLALFFLILVLLNKQGLLFWYTGFSAAIITLLIELWIYKRTKLTIVDNRDSL